jgi:hypothetical protein
VRSAFLITLGQGCDEELYNVTDSKSDPPGGGLSAWQVGDIVEITNFQKLPKGALRLQAGASVILSGVKEVSTIPVDTKSIKNTSNNSVSIAHLSTFGNFRIPSNGRIARLHCINCGNQMESDRCIRNCYVSEDSSEANVRLQVFAEPKSESGDTLEGIMSHQCYSDCSGSLPFPIMQKKTNMQIVGEEIRKS